jgi:outer membrane protein TolC
MRTSLIWGLALCVQALATPPPLTFDDLRALAKPDPHLVRAEADLAARSRLLAATGGVLREGPTVVAEAGRRSSPFQASTDKVAQVEAPLLLAPGLRKEAVLNLEKSGASTLALARAEGRLRLRSAYLEAWEGQAQLRLRQDQLGLLRSWREVARARVESGSDPAYQGDLVQGELLRQQTELGMAQRRAAESWAALRNLAELPPDPRELADPGPAALPDPAHLSAAFQAGLLRRALQEQQRLDRSSFELQQALRGSRLSLRGSYSAEGDERVTRFGIALRLPRSGELQALGRERETGKAALRVEAEATERNLVSRFQVALERLKSFGEESGPTDFAASLAAVDLRLKEGKERPSDALALRRQLLEARFSALQRRREAHALAAEIEHLCTGVPR